MRIPEIEEPDELPEIERNVPLALRNALDDAFDAWPVKGDWRAAATAIQASGR